MFNFIIYEDDKAMKNIYVDIIHKFMGNKNSNYNLYYFSRYSEEMEDKIFNKICGKKIYLLDVEVPGMSGFELAKEIRDSGDWFNQIIIITGYDRYSYLGVTSRILMLDFISKANIETELVRSLNIAINILNMHASLSFKQNSEIIQVLYSDICYIEKNLNDNSATVFTKNNKYTIRCSINNLMKILSDDPRFFKCHRSCIVNLNNIKVFDIDKNIIKFKNGETNLVARDKKRELKDRLMNKVRL